MSTEIDLPSRTAAARTAQFVGQATAIEQARAVAEVAAAVQVAQQFPRDLDRVRREMQIACSSMELAREAFYAVKNRGEGPSVHLARELASIYGNFQSGVNELRRDDQAGESEVQSFAWDVERNTRQSRTFIHPHARMKSGKREPLTDLHDIYLSNQNTGARALRECIYGALPKWLVREAERACRTTLEKGDGKPLAERADSAVAAFAGINVTEDQVVTRIGRKRAEWTPQDLASLEVVFMSIRRGEATAEEQFPPRRVTAEEIGSTPAAPASDVPPQPPAARMANRAQLTKLHAILGDLQVAERPYKLRVLSALAARPVPSSSELTADEAKMVIDALAKIAERDDATENLAFVVDAAESEQSS